MDLTRETIQAAVDRDEIGVVLEGFHILTTGERIGFVGSIHWPAAGIHNATWDGPEWLAIRHFGLVDEVQGAMLRAVIRQWSTMTRTTEFGVGMNVANPGRHREAIAELAALGCSLFADRVVDDSSARRVGAGVVASSGSSSGADFVGITASSVTDERNRQVALGVVEGARRAGAFTYAEGITTVDQLEILRLMGVDVGHGPVFDRLGPEDFPARTDPGIVRSHLRLVHDRPVADRPMTDDDSGLR